MLLLASTLVALTTAAPAGAARSAGDWRPAGARPAVDWRRPVPGPVARSFTYGRDPFRRGWHRGVDLAAAPGAAVRAACTGRVVTARSGGPGGGVVTLRCGPWRVTLLPLAPVAVRAGGPVRAGARVGTLARGTAHAGLHLGVRRADDRFAYVDPLPFLRPAGPRRGPPPPTAAAPRATRAPPIAAPAPRGPEMPVRVRSGAPLRALAPWSAWAGLALVLLGAVGGGVRLRVRGRRAARAAALPEPVG